MKEQLGQSTGEETLHPFWPQSLGSQCLCVVSTHWDDFGEPGLAQAQKGQQSSSQHRLC